MSRSDATSYDKSIFDEESIRMHIQFGTVSVFDLIKSTTSLAYVSKQKVQVCNSHSDCNMYAVSLVGCSNIRHQDFFFRRTNCVGCKI